MDYEFGIGKIGVALAAFLAIAMCVLSLLFHPVEISPIQYGICLPSPDSWNIDPIWSWGINTFLIGLITLLLYLINKNNNFIRTTEPALEALFLIMAASSPWFTQGLNISVLLCLVNVVSLGIIFTAYSSQNATQQMFILGVLIGVGSMFQYAFLPMAMVYFLWALFMKVFRIKETLAFLIGIVCPYWIALGSGWLHFSDLQFPSITPFFGLDRDHSEFFVLLAGICAATCMGCIVGLVNFVKLYAGNSKVNALNLCVSTLGAAMVLYILVDFDNMAAYVTTLYMTCAVQLANICALWNPKMPWTVTMFPSLIFIGAFVCSILI